MKGPKKPLLYTGSKLNLKRDHMAVKPLFQQDGMSKLVQFWHLVSRFRYPRRHPEHLTHWYPNALDQRDTLDFYGEFHSQQRPKTQTHWVFVREVQGACSVLMQGRGSIIVRLRPIFGYRAWFRLHQDNSNTSARWLRAAKEHFALFNRWRNNYRALWVMDPCQQQRSRDQAAFYL